MRTVREVLDREPLPPAGKRRRRFSPLLVLRAGGRRIADQPNASSASIASRRTSVHCSLLATAASVHNSTPNSVSSRDSVSKRAEIASSAAR